MHALLGRSGSDVASYLSKNATGSLKKVKSGTVVIGCGPLMVFGRSANRRRARCLDITVVLRDEDDRAVPLSLPAGEDLMHGLQSAGVDITSICHGRAVCGMCRVLVTSAATSIVEAARDERRLLDILAGTTPQHRLACQISLGPEHEGLTFALDPPST